MKYMRQFGIILGVTCAGELMKYFIPLPIPGSISVSYTHLTLPTIA